jgi:hypothetical protein
VAERKIATPFIISEKENQMANETGRNVIIDRE